MTSISPFGYDADLPPLSQPATKRVGLFHRLRVALFGERDRIADELAELSRQGAGMARAAHLVSFLLLVAFSLASVVALTGDALTAVQTAWQQGRANVTDTIAIVVSVLLVVGVDFAALWAANRLRIMANRQTRDKSQWVDIGIIVLSVVFESSTYVLMSALYDSIPTQLVWAIIVGRGITGPLIAIYLQMARPLPVSARDILYKTELASGTAVITHAVRIASDPGAGLGESARIYRASALANPTDKARLDELVDALAQPQSMAFIAAEDELPPPTGPGTPLVAQYAQGVSSDSGEHALVRIPSSGSGGNGGRRARTTSSNASGSTASRAQAKPTRLRGSTPTYENQARRAWINGATSIPKMMQATGMSQGAAQAYVRQFRGEEHGEERGRRQQAPLAHPLAHPLAQ